MTSVFLSMAPKESMVHMFPWLPVLLWVDNLSSWLTVHDYDVLGIVCYLNDNNTCSYRFDVI